MRAPVAPRLRRHRRRRRRPRRDAGRGDLPRVRSDAGMSARVRVDLGLRGYDVVVGENAVAELDILRGRSRVAIVTQEKIPAEFRLAVERTLDDAGVENATFVIGDGED